MALGKDRAVVGSREQQNENSHPGMVVVMPLTHDAVGMHSARFVQ